MFEFKSGKYFWDGTAYDTFGDAMYKMCCDITFEDVIPKFGDTTGMKLGHKELRQYILLYGIYYMDIPALMQSMNADQYKRYTGKNDSRILPLIKQSNPVYVKTLILPMGYESNKPLQCTLLPRLEVVYEAEHRSVPLKRGKFPYATVLSYLCDYILFNPNTSPFKKGLDIFTILGEDQRTADLDAHVQHKDLDRARLLSTQLAAGEITVPDDAFISIGDLRKGRYDFKSKNLYPDVNCVDMLLECPPALQSTDYSIWLRNAAEARGYTYEDVKVIKEVFAAKPVVQEKPIITHQDTPVEENIPSLEMALKHFQSGKAPEEEPVQDVQIPEMPTDPPVVEEEPFVVSSATVIEAPIETNIPTQNDLDMALVARVYCNINEVPYEQTIAEIQALGLLAWEDINRALPVYLRRAGHSVDVSVLTEYSRSLDKYYGGFALKSDF